MKTGVLLINLGTPDSPKTADVRKYLTQFLNDPRVIDINPGNPGSYPRFITYFNGTVLFTAHDGDNGAGNRDLFRLDGNFVPLAVGLSDFAGSLFDRSVKLNWTTATETNTKKFEIERSLDGVNFKTIALVLGQDPKQEGCDCYEGFDKPDTRSKKYFYRLKHVGLDGEIELSETKMLALNK